MASYPGYSYDFYRSVIVAVPLVLPLLAIPVSTVLSCICCCMHKSTPQRLLEVAEPFLTSKEKLHYIHEGKLSHSVLVLVIIKTTLVIMFGLAEYLSEALIADSARCLTGSWDCFMSTGGEVVRVTNCSDYTQSDGNDIECYRIAFEVLNVGAQVGGITFVTHVLNSSYVTFYYSIRFVSNRCLRFMAASCVVFVYFFVFVVLPICFSIKYEVTELFETITVKIHDILIAVYYPLIYAVITMAMAIHSKCIFDDHDTSYHPNTTIIIVGRASEVGGAMVPFRNTNVTVAHGNKVQVLNVM